MIELTAETDWVALLAGWGCDVVTAAVKAAREAGAGVWAQDATNTGVEGIISLRGSILPVIDLRQFLGGGLTSTGRNTRVLVVNHREIPAGLLVDEVLGFRRYAESEFTGDAPPTVTRCERYLAGAFRRGPEQWPVLSLRTLVESPAFLDAAA